MTTQEGNARKPVGYSIKIFLADGTPSGLRFVEKTNWSGLGVVCPRPRFSDAKQREEFSKAGIYLLLGPSESSDLPVAYIGEADPVGDRLKQHYSDRENWTVTYFFTSKDNNLNKAHIQYLESKLIAIARDLKRCKLDNRTDPDVPSLSEADEAEAATFLEEMLLCFPVLGVTIFAKPEAKPSKRNLLFLKNKGISAEGYESEDGFVVKSGSTAVVATVESIQSFMLALRQELLENKIFVKRKDEFYELSQDYKFSSPSTAASVLIGASINGRDSWKTSDGKTLKQLQEQEAKK